MINGNMYVLRDAEGEREREREDGREGEKRLSSDLLVLLVFTVSQALSVKRAVEVQTKVSWGLQSEANFIHISNLVRYEETILKE